jgi:hypothetical protein
MKQRRRATQHVILSQSHSITDKSAVIDKRAEVGSACLMGLEGHMTILLMSQHRSFRIACRAASELQVADIVCTEMVGAFGKWLVWLASSVFCEARV